MAPTGGEEAVTIDLLASESTAAKVERKGSALHIITSLVAAL